MERSDASYQDFKKNSINFNLFSSPYSKRGSRTSAYSTGLMGGGVQNISILHWPKRGSRTSANGMCSFLGSIQLKRTVQQFPFVGFFQKLCFAWKVSQYSQTCNFLDVTLWQHVFMWTSVLQDEVCDVLDEITSNQWESLLRFATSSIVPDTGSLVCE